MSIESTMAYIHNVDWQKTKPGLSRTQALLKTLGNPEKELKFVHVAGTNGKGSTSACIASVLQRAGYRTGLYTSPYILRFNERMQVDGVEITDEELEELVDEMRPVTDVMEDAPTEFEIVTAIGMKFFLRKKCDIVVLEVGLGGEFDSTNVIDTPEVAVITAIGFDHMEQLGNTLTEIAGAKAGIIKPGGAVAVYGGEAEVEEVFERTCAERGATLHRADFAELTIHGFDLRACHFDFGKFKNISLPLVGTYQPNNAALAITALEILREKGYKISDEDIMDGLANVNWPGRFEILCEDPVFVLDGAHNPHGIEATAKSLKEHFKDKKIVFLMGVMRDKDIGNMLGFIMPFAKSFVAVAPPYYRAMAAEDLKNILDPYGFPVKACDSVEEAVAEAISEAGVDGIVCALGSLYFSGPIRAAVNDTL